LLRFYNVKLRNFTPWLSFKRDEAARKMVADSTAQIAKLEKQKQAPGSRRIEALEDVCWALLNTNEFLFQH